MNISAAIIIIGNEILSGRTADLNIHFIAKHLSAVGIKLKEVRVIPDIKETIVSVIKDLSPKYDYIFTTGGIGPTHDDITAEAMSEAFGRRYVLNPEAHEMLRTGYAAKGETLNPAREKMAFMPENVKLIDNQVSSAPGFIIENVYVLPGVPYIMQAMFESLLPTLKHGQTIESKSLNLLIGESFIAAEFENLQKEYPEIEMGSYPFLVGEKHATSLVLRSDNHQVLEEAYKKLKNIFSYWEKA